MSTQVLAVNALTPEPEIMAQAGAVVRAGGLVAFPTETVYGLGANALDAVAVARIFAAKGRPPNNPLIVHLAHPDHVPLVAAAWPDVARRLAQRFWPGPLTLVLPKRDLVPDAVTAGGPTVAVRVPDHPVANALIRAAGVPLAAPSANRSARLSPTRAEHVLRGLGGRIDLVLDGGATAGGLESTVLDLTFSPPRLLRPGLIMPGEIEAVIGPIARVPQATAGRKSPGGVAGVRARSKQGQYEPVEIARSPGMLARHYAPSVPLECAGDDGWKRVEALCQRGLRVGWLMLSAAEAPRQWPNLTAIRMPADESAYAANLYAALHSLEDAGVDRIVAALPPDTPEWLAVRDRLRRASAQ